MTYLNDIPDLSCGECTLRLVKLVLEREKYTCPDLNCKNAYKVIEFPPPTEAEC